MSVKYPTEFPAEAIRHVIGFLRGADSTETVQHVVNDGYEILGYALGQLVGQPAMPVGSAGGHKASTNKELADKLEAAIAPNAAVDPKSINPFLLSLLIEVAKRIFDKFLSA
jgi:hypothetical protein